MVDEPLILVIDDETGSRESMAIALEKAFVADCLPVNAVGLSAEEFCTYIDYIADRRLAGCGLRQFSPGVRNPFPWLAEMMDILLDVRTICFSFVMADADSNIGWQTTGSIPKRSGYSGRLPADGSSGIHDWQGFVSAEDMPTR